MDRSEPRGAATAAERETREATPAEFVEQYIAGMEWRDDTPEEVRELVRQNVRMFAYCQSRIAAMREREPSGGIGRTTAPVDLTEPVADLRRRLEDARRRGGFVALSHATAAALSDALSGADAPDDGGCTARHPVTDALCPHCGHEWRRHDPEDGRCDAATAGGACDCGVLLRFHQRRNAELSRAALLASPAERDREADEALQEQIDSLVVAALGEARWGPYGSGGRHQRPVGQIADELTDRILAALRAIPATPGAQTPRIQPCPCCQTPIAVEAGTLRCLTRAEAGAQTPPPHACDSWPCPECGAGAQTEPREGEG